MTTIKQNAEFLCTIFPNLHLDAFIRENCEKELNWACDYILSNSQLFSVKEKCKQKSVSAQDSVDTVDPATLAPRNAVDFTDPIFIDCLERLVDYFFHEKDQPVENSDYFRHFLCCIFNKVELRLMNQLADDTNYSAQAIMVLLFFVNNGLVHHPPFQRILNQLRKDRQFMVESGILLPPMTYRYHVAIEKFNIPDRDKNKFFQMLTHFELKLIELAIDSYDNFGLLTWKQERIVDIFPDEIKHLCKFYCKVCCENFLIREGLCCDAAFNDNASSSSADVQHIFCISCVCGQVNATLAGAMLHQSGLGIQCLSTDCTNPILFKDIQKYLPAQTRVAFEKKLLNKNLCEAGVEALEHCLKCDFAMSIEIPKEQDKVFRCLSCFYEFCRFCKADWFVHFGKSCAELKVNNIRQAFENELSEAIIRYCPKCKLQFVKLEACNKMTCCQCKTTMCYICRTANIDYSHFCNHFRDPDCPNKICAICKIKKCLLWEDYKQYDEAKIAKITVEKNHEIEQAKLSLRKRVADPRFLPKFKRYFHITAVLVNIFYWLYHLISYFNFTYGSNEEQPTELNYYIVIGSPMLILFQLFMILIT